MNEKVLASIFKHAEECYPKECCGLIVMIRRKQYYRPCRNITTHQGSFVIHPEDYAEAEDSGDILKVVHSHCNQNAKPSQADLVGCEKSGLPWVIVSWPTKQVQEFKPDGYQAPLIGREFVYGIIDCYTLTQDYYRNELGIELPVMDRPTNGWWNRGENFYLDNFEKAGFIETAQLEKHAVILMQVSSPVPNHAAIYLGDNNIILHHLQNRLSCREVYGGYWQKNTWSILKYAGVQVA